MDAKMKKLVVGLACATILLLGSTAALQENGMKSVERKQGEWKRIYDGGAKWAGFNDVESTRDGGFILAGGAGQEGGGGEYDEWIIKVDANGNKIWDKRFGGKYHYTGGEVVETDDGYVIGATRHAESDPDFWLAKVDKHGHEIWNNSYGWEESAEVLYSLTETRDGGYAMAGDRWSNTSNDIVVIKTGDDGNVQWRKIFGGNESDWAEGIIETEDGYLVSGITASYTPHGGDWDTWLIKIDERGNEMWNKTYGWERGEFAALVDETDNGYVIAGHTFSTPSTWGDAYLIEVDEDGNEQWKRRYGGWNSDHVKDFKATDDGYILAGSTHTYNVGVFDAWLLKVGTQGNEMWNKSFGGRGRDLASGVVALNGSYVWAGTTTPHPAVPRIRSEKAWLVKCGDDAPPNINIVRPKEGYLYLFDREIMPSDNTLIIGGITVTAEADDSDRIEKAEFYVTGEIYERLPRAVRYNPPYQWKCRRLGIGQPIRITAAGYYGDAGGVAVDHTMMQIINLCPLPSLAKRS